VNNDEISAAVVKDAEPESAPVKAADSVAMLDGKLPDAVAVPNVEAPASVKSAEPVPQKPPLTIEQPAKQPEMEIASSKPIVPSDVTPDKAPGTTKPDELPTKSQGETPAPTDTMGSVGGTPNIPAEFLPLARDGKDLFEKGDYRGAEKIYEKVLAKVPNNLYILSNLGVVRFRAGKYKQAEEVLLRATKVAPEDAFSHCTLGIVYYTEQKLDEAVSALTKALAINPKNATAHNYLGITAAGKGWQEAAQKELETATTLDPSYADAHFNLAVVFATQTPPNKEKARQYYKRANELGAEADSAMEQLIK
jgi:Flp pilus assembly protein TadD